jgi:tetratricopeptide (TPR) repeat protein
VIYDPRDAIDRRYIEGEVLPQFADAEVLRVPFAGHPANQFLGDIGFIAPYVRALLAERAPPSLDRRGQRARSATYHQVLAQHCLQHGHLAWADALVARSLALAPGRMLALRTQGMVRLAQARWDEAVQALEAALAPSPEDPLTLSLLERARQGAAGAAPAAPSARELAGAPPVPAGRAAAPWTSLWASLMARLRAVLRTGRTRS